MTELTAPAAEAEPDVAHDRPVVRLKPRADARKLRHGFPWVYDGDLVTDRRTKALPPGALAVLEDAERRPIGLGAVNTGSRIAVRLLDADPEVRIDEAWFAARLARAAALRERLFEAPVYRLVHAEADGLPGVVIDRFGEICAIQPNAAWAEALLGPLVAALRGVTGCTKVVKNAGGRARKLEGLDDETLVLTGEIDGPVPVQMNGATFMADLLGGQKTGLFLDQRGTQAAVARLAGGARVLDVFSHVGGFALAALAQGAATALAVDASAAALDLARQGATASGQGARFETRQGDAFAVMAELAAAGEAFDVVVCDPPAFAPAKPALVAGLRAYEKVARQGAHLTAPGGFLTLCSCSHAVGLDAFREACARGIGRAGRQAQLLRTGFAGPDHPQHPWLAESGYLKSLIYRLD